MSMSTSGVDEWVSAQLALQVQMERPAVSCALDDVLRRHVGGKTEALKEVEKIYDAVRNGTFGRGAADALTLRELGDRYFSKYVSPKTGRPLGRTERYRWNVM